jgi:flagellar hook-basal body complex protein FliE
MIHAVQPIHVPSSMPLAGPGKVDLPQGAESFRAVLADSVKQLQSAAQGEQLAGLGGLAPQTDLTMHVMMQIQDRIVGAYQEVQNIRV